MNKFSHGRPGYFYASTHPIGIMFSGCPSLCACVSAYICACICVPGQMNLPTDFPFCEDIFFSVDMLFYIQLVKYVCNLLLIFTQVTCCQAQLSHAYLLVYCTVIYRQSNVQLLALVEYIYFSTFKTTCRALLMWCYSVSVNECRLSNSSSCFSVLSCQYLF